ncbi:MAG: DUF5906 domain-containing protein [Helicobacteraceae bacterium]|jgi:P4 family phage/plasmid primase-like protien|nr:DUF5906 domain-containing protein [Helicobacteraceae bacterium]
MKENIFNLVKEQVDFRAYLGEFYGVEWRKNNGNCPLCGNKDAFSFNDKKNYGFCFACASGGDVIKWVENIEQIAPLEAARKICRDRNIPIGEDEDMSDEEKERAKKTREDREKELEKKRSALEAEAAEREKEAIKQATYQGGKTHFDLIDLIEPLKAEHIDPLFPNDNAIFREECLKYLGWNANEESIEILIRDGEIIRNIKTRQKWEGKGRVGSGGIRKTGKWLGIAGARAFPFPLDHYKERKNLDDRVFVCEGEKDALNLVALDVNVLTLGGVSSKWEGANLELLREKDVYIWFDHDIKHRDHKGNITGGYPNMILRYQEIKKVARSCSVVLPFKIDPLLTSGYDVTDFIRDRKIEDKNQLWKAIAYSVFALTNEIIDEISEHTESDFSAYKTEARITPLKEIFKAIGEKTLPVKGERDIAGLDTLMDQFYKTKKNHKNFIGAVTESFGKSKDETEKLLNIFERAMNFQKKLVNEYKKTNQADIYREMFRAANEAGFPFANYKEELYIWNGAHYQKLETYQITDFYKSQCLAARIDIKSQVSDQLKHFKNNMINFSQNLDGTKKEQANKRERFMAFKNGTAIIRENGKFTFRPTHEKNDAIVNILPFSYDPKAKAPKWEKFLARVLPDEMARKCVMEFFGYCLFPSNFYEKFLFLYGSRGSNGKSTILAVLRKFFSKENVSNLQLQQFVGHELVALHNKMLNIGSEIDASKIDAGQMSMLKALTNKADVVTVNPKNREQFDLENTPKLAFSANRKPKSNMDDGVFRRMLLINFTQEIKGDEKVYDIVERFNDEMSGILNLALEGLQRLIKNGDFSKSAAMERDLNEYVGATNQIRSFVTESIVSERQTMITRRDLYMLYSAWAKQNGENAITQRAFTEKLREELRNANINFTEKAVKIKGAVERCWVGIYARKVVEEFSDKGKERKAETVNISASEPPIVLVLPQHETTEDVYADNEGADDG